MLPCDREFAAARRGERAGDGGGAGVRAARLAPARTRGNLLARRKPKPRAKRGPVRARSRESSRSCAAAYFLQYFLRANRAQVRADHPTDATEENLGCVRVRLMYSWSLLLGARAKPRAPTSSTLLSPHVTTA